MLDGKTWALSEVPVVGSESDAAQPYSPIQPPSVVTQHMEGQRRFVLINSQVQTVEEIVWLSTELFSYL